MMKRIFLLIIGKICSIFDKSISVCSRVEYSKISKHAKVWRHCKVFKSSLGDYSYLGPHCRLIYANVGKYCSIGADCAIGMGTHSLNYISTSSIFTAKKNGTGYSWADKSSFEEYKEITIGNDVWIGQRVMIMGGVNIGDGAVVGAGSIVTKNVPPYAIVAGVPAKIVRYRFSDEVIEKLEASQWWTLDDNVLKDNIALFQKPAEKDNIEKLISHCNKK